MTNPFLQDLRSALRAPATYIVAGGSVWLITAGLIAARLGAPVSMLALLLSMSLAWMTCSLGAQGIALLTRHQPDARREASYTTLGGVVGVLATTAIFLWMPALEATRLFAMASEAGFIAIQVLLIGVIIAVALRPAGRFRSRF